MATDVRRDGGAAVIRATPKQYRNPGRVSFYLELDIDLLEDARLDFCDVVLDDLRGADEIGQPAEQIDPIFVPDPYLDVRVPNCRL